ncbi:MAG TPA: non-homologous end-joining DNA ligase [Jatrophihabitantaceae bacterium]|jgi:DNA ligase D-like protein (predicted ligase)|nr:non-homologous end-joining DNA ligase [Jatrophihabitantaceae bacterium]
MTSKQALPDFIAPMLATLTDDRFSDPNWVFERKWDGVRCLAFRTAAGQVRLRSRNEQRLDGTYPEIADALATQCDVAAVLDGEVVAFDGRRTSFARLQGRMGLSDPDAARATGIAVYYYVFDVLHLDGHDVRGLPLRDRKRLLRDSVRFADPLRFTTHRNTAGEEEYRKACERGDEGVIAKRADSPYRSGRSADWLKFKCVRDQELVIGGFTAPKGSRVAFGALLVGYFEGADFVYAGKVGTGFDDVALRDLHARMQRIEQDGSPFARGRLRERDVHWVKPQLVAQIGFAEWTRDGLLRHPRYLGLRTDKTAREVVRET